MKEIKRNIAYVGLGSNIENRLEYLKKATREIDNNENCKVIKLSSIYESKPFGEKNQANFLNAVAKIETNLSPQEFFRLIKKIERKLGRKETYKWGPREIDIDLLFYNDIVFSDENLTVPHPGISQRDFVITPLMEIAPMLFHPVLKQKISDIYISESDRNIIRRVSQKIL